MSAADECTSPQICTGVGTTPGKCVTPVSAGLACKQADGATAAGKLLGQSHSMVAVADMLKSFHNKVWLSATDIECTCPPGSQCISHTHIYIYIHTHIYTHITLINIMD